MIINSQPKVKDNKEYSPIKRIDYMNKTSIENKNAYKQHQPGHQIINHSKVPLFFKGKKPLNKINEDKCAVSVYNSEMSQSVPIAVNNSIKHEVKQSQPTNIQNSSYETNSPFQKLKQLATPIVQKDIKQNLDSKNQKQNNIFQGFSNKDKKTNHIVRSPDFFKNINQKRKELSLQKKKKHKNNQVYHIESDNIPQSENQIKKKTHHKKSSSLHNAQQYYQKTAEVETKQSLKGNQNHQAKEDKLKQKCLIKNAQISNYQQNHSGEECQKNIKSVFKFKTSRPYEHHEQKSIKKEQKDQSTNKNQNKSNTMLHSIKSNQNLNNKIKRHYQVKENGSLDFKKQKPFSPSNKSQQKIKASVPCHNSNTFPIQLNLDVFQNKFEKKIFIKEKEDKTRTDRSYKETKQPMSSSLNNEYHYKSSQALEKKQKKKKIQKFQHIPSFFVQRRHKRNPESTKQIKQKEQQNQMQFNSIYEIEEKYMNIIKKLNNQLLKLKKQFNDKIEIIQKQANLIKEYQSQIMRKNKQLEVKNNQIMQIQKCLNINYFDESNQQKSSITGKRNSRHKTLNNQVNYERSSSLSHQNSSPRNPKFNVFELQQYKKKILDLEILSRQLKQKLTQRSIKNSKMIQKNINNKIESNPFYSNYNEFENKINTKTQANVVQNNNENGQYFIEVQTFDEYQIQVSPPVSRRNSQISDD